MDQINIIIQIKMLSLFKTVQRNLPAKARALKTRCNISAQQMSSQVHRDLQQTLKPKLYNQTNIEHYRGQFANKLDDYGVSAVDTAFDAEGLSLQKQIQVDENSLSHPLQIAGQISRAQADVYQQLKQNQVILTNLSINSDHFSHPDKVKSFLLNHVHKDLEIEQIRLVPAIKTSDTEEKVAYIIVTVASKRQAHLIKKQLRQTWVDDSLLKVRVSEDASKENFNNRTILLRGIPNHFNQRQILRTFIGESEGAVVGIELPAENIKLSDFISERSVNSIDSPIQQEKHIAFKQAQKVVQDSLKIDQEFQDTISGQLGQETLAKLLSTEVDLETSQLIADEKMSSLLRMITRLQAEGIQVLESKLNLLRVKDSVQSSTTGSVLSQEKIQTNITDNMSANQAQLEVIMKYLRDNNESSPAVVNEPLENLLRLGQSEIANVFDSLLIALEQREALIEKRISQQLQHFGINERILIDQKNFNKELEDIETTSLSFKPEELISAQDQINSVLAAKNMTPEQKFTRLIKGALNPFANKNFSDNQMRLIDLPELDEDKKFETIDPRQPRSVLRMLREGNDLKYEQKKMVKALIQELRDKVETPFDELYHKEKALVQAVIQADKALKEKQALLKSPITNQLVSKSDNDRLNNESLLTNNSIFEQSKIRESNRLNKIELQDSAIAAEYAFETDSVSQLNSLLDNGTISQSEYDQQVQLQRESQLRNLGYCFITFSHADEARNMLLSKQNPYYMGQKIQIDLKSNVDHGELDFDFFISKAKNDVKLIDEMKQLREAKQELRNFEAELDSKLPSLKKIRDFRELSKNIIENDQGLIRGSAAAQRSKDEQDRLSQKIKDLQTRYPHVDLTQLFETDQAEQSRKALHKKAFASYKAHEFLKNGVQQTSESRAPQLSEAKRRLQENDPYNFPALNQTVAAVLSPDVMQTTFNDLGDKITRPGRRFKGFTQNEFIEAFFGKDMMRQASVDFREDPLFMNQKTLKEQYPLSEFLKTPAVEAKIANLKALGIEPSIHSIKNKIPYPADPELAHMLRQQEGKLERGELIKDRPHPTDSSRTLLGDFEQTLEKYQQSRTKRGLGDSIDFQEISILRQGLAEEYKIGEKDWFDLVKRGKYKHEEEEEEAVATTTDEIKSAKFQQSYDQESKQNNGGSWLRQQQFGQQSVGTSNVSRTKQSLKQFTEDNEKDQEDNDTYEKYQQTLNEKRHPDLKLDKQDTQPEMPRYESYFKSQAENLHPFEQITNRLNESLREDQSISEAEKQEEKELYQRELIGRMMGEKLTPRQFEIIAGVYKSSDLKLARVKDTLNEEFLNDRDIIRLQQEQVEKARRIKVKSGKWTEEESHRLLQQEIQKISEQMPGPARKKILQRDLAEAIDALKTMDNPERLLEKEYYFDERLGLSLDDHVADLKHKFPGVKVQTRRDRDGLAIVKTMYEQEYKYNLTKFENWDHNQKKIEHLATIECVLEKLMPEGPQSVIDNLPETVQEIKNLLNGTTEQEYELDAWTKLQIQQLVHDQKDGKICPTTVAEKLFEISEDANIDRSQPLPRSSAFLNEQPKQSDFEMIYEDRERFRTEIFEQLVKRAKKHLFSTRRVDSDFVVPRVDEAATLHNQVQSHQNKVQQLTQEAESMEKNKDFDREAFDKIKKEISERKQAKERLLSQGLPEFKAYLRF